MIEKFPFKQIQTGLLAFVADIEAKMQEMLPELPVFVLSTGDASYLLNSKFIENDTKEIYEKIPRFVLKFENFETQQDTKTNIFNRWEYNYENQNWETQFRRNQLNFNVIGTIVSSNFLDALMHTEMFFSLISRENAFTYEYLGSTFEAAYSVDDPDPFEMPEMDNANRNFTQSKNITLQLHIYNPNVKSIRKLIPTIIKNVELGVNNQILDPETLELTDEKIKINIPNIDREDINYPFHKYE